MGIGTNIPGEENNHKDPDMPRGKALCKAIDRGTQKVENRMKGDGKTRLGSREGV